MADGLVAALARAQLAFPAIVKSHTNPAFKGSQYADVADVLAAVRPVLAAEGIAVMQHTEINDEGGVVLVTTLAYGNEDEGECMHSRFPLQTHGLNAQGVGSLLTYHRRYQLCALLGVHPVGDDDDGNLAATAAPPISRNEGYTAGALPVGWETEPLVKFTFSELRTIAAHIGHGFSGGSKSELIRQLEPLVRAASGEEPFETDAPAVAHVEPPSKPFEPVVSDIQKSTVATSDINRHDASDDSGSVRRARNSALRAP